MANEIKITELPLMDINTVALGDPVVMVDISDTTEAPTGTTKKLDLLGWMQNGGALGNYGFNGDLMTYKGDTILQMQDVVPGTIRYMTLINDSNTEEQKLQFQDATRTVILQSKTDDNNVMNLVMGNDQVSINAEHDGINVGLGVYSGGTGNPKGAKIWGMEPQDIEDGEDKLVTTKEYVKSLFGDFSFQGNQMYFKTVPILGDTTTQDGRFLKLKTLNTVNLLDLNISKSELRFSYATSDYSLVSLLQNQAYLGVNVGGETTQILINSTEGIRLVGLTNAKIDAATGLSAVTKDWVQANAGGGAQPYKTVEAYGAVGDGTTDSAAGINAAIQAAVEGEIVYALGAHYILEDTIIMRKGIPFIMAVDTIMQGKVGFYGRLLYWDEEPFHIEGGEFTVPNYQDQPGDVPYHDYMLEMKVTRDHTVTTISPTQNTYRKNSVFKNVRMLGPNTGDNDKYSKLPKGLYIHSNVDTQNSGDLVIGRQYIILDNSGGADFTGVGAPDNNVNTDFVATGRTPTWGTGEVRNYGNASYFCDIENIYIGGCADSVYCDGDPLSGMVNSWKWRGLTLDVNYGPFTATNRSAGHIFSTLNIQPPNAATGTFGEVRQLDINSSYNVIVGHLWDAWYSDHVHYGPDSRFNEINDMGWGDITAYTQNEAAAFTLNQLGNSPFLKPVYTKSTDSNYSSDVSIYNPRTTGHGHLRVGVDNERKANIDTNTRLIVGGNMDFWNSTQGYGAAATTNINVNEVYTMGLDTGVVSIESLFSPAVVQKSTSYYDQTGVTGDGGFRATSVGTSLTDFPATIYYSGVYRNAGTYQMFASICNLGNDFLAIGSDSSRRIAFAGNLSSNVINFWTAGPRFVDDEFFTLFVIFRSGTQLEIYFNGTRYDWAPTNDPGSFPTTLDDLVAGRRDYNGTYQTVGDMYAVAFYNRALTVKEMADINSMHSFPVDAMGVYTDNKTEATWFADIGIDLAEESAGLGTSGVKYTIDSANVYYDNTVSSLNANTAQAAIDELALQVNPAAVASYERHSGLSYSIHSASFVSDATDIYIELERDGGGDVDYIVNQEDLTLNCTTGPGTGGKARVALIQGTATNPVRNYIYITKLSAGEAQIAATTTLPTGAFAWVGIVLVQDKATFDATGVISWQRFNDSYLHGGRGLHSYHREKTRLIGTTWAEGVEASLVIDSGQSPDSVKIAVTEGIVYQMHRQTFNEILSASFKAYVVNDPDTPWRIITDLNQITKDASGNLLANNDYIGLEILGWVSSQGIEDTLAILLPTGVYTKEAEVRSDADDYGVVSLPPDVTRGNAFRIGRVILKYETIGGGTWTNVLGGTAVQDRRGYPFGIATGGGGGSAALSAINIDYNNIDSNLTATNVKAALDELDSIKSAAIFVEGSDIEASVDLQSILAGNEGYILRVNTSADGFDFAAYPDIDWIEAAVSATPTDAEMRAAFGVKTSNFVGVLKDTTPAARLYACMYYLDTDEWYYERMTKAI